MDSQTLFMLNQSNGTAQKPWGYVSYSSQTAGGSTPWNAFYRGTIGASAYGMGWNSLGLTTGMTGIYLVYFTIYDYLDAGNTANMLGGGISFGEDETIATPTMINSTYMVLGLGLQLTGTWIGPLSAGTSLQLCMWVPAGNILLGAAGTIGAVYIGPQ
jgi:hypothetical protein